MNQSLRKVQKAKYVLLGVGLLMFVVSWSVTPTSPECSGAEMTPDTVCVYDDGDIKTYDEMVDEEQTNMLILRWGGLALAAVGVGIVALGRRDQESDAALRAEASTGVPPVTPQVQPGWFADPAGRHQVRWFDGTTWTDRVSTNGVEGVDPLTGPTAQ